MNTDPKPTPIVSPIADLLRSRAFIVMIVTALVNMLIIAIPDFGQYRDDMIAVVTGLALALIGKMTAEDVALKLGDAKVEAAALSAPTNVSTATGDVNVNQPPAEPPPTTFSRN